MLESLILILDDDAPSFCYHENGVAKLDGTINEELANETVIFCLKNNLQLTVIYSNNSYPKSIYKSLDLIPHTKIVPFGYRYTNESSIVISDRNHLDDIAKSKVILNNLIFKISKKELPDLGLCIERLLGRFQRLNVIFTDLETFGPKDYHILEEQLNKLEPILVNGLNKSTFEINFVTDRWLLSGMNNCGAGIKHLTIAPNGNLYICPSFYYEDPTDSIGDISTGFKIRNEQLFDLDHAPICRNCDSFQCKRCVFLNKLTTLEINTPSAQQCIVSHLERNYSKQILEKLNSLNKFLNLTAIEEIDYLDPIELIINNRNNNIINTQKWNKTQMLQKKL